MGNKTGLARSLSDIRAQGTYKFDLAELSGAFGDVGTFVPLAVALIALNGLQPGAVFLVAGVFYIGSALYYRVPMSVQPLKAFSAIAIASGLGPGVISAGAMLMGGALVLIAMTGLMGLIAKLFSKPVVRGIQLSVGLILLRSGWDMVTRPQLFIGGPKMTWDVLGANLPLGLSVAALAAMVLFVTRSNNRLPSSLAAIALGLVIGIIWGPKGWLEGIGFHPQLSAIAIPRGQDFLQASLLLVIPQLPLTLGNAVIAACDTARSYFGDRANRVTYRALPLGMGLTNLAAGLVGGVPLCHGAGGITAHYRFGARTGGATIIIGVTWILLGIFLADSILLLLGLIPYAVLGVLLAVVGVEHALFVRDLRGWFEAAVAIAIAVTTLVTGNLAVGVAIGLLLYHGGSWEVAKRPPKNP